MGAALRQSTFAGSGAESWVSGEIALCVRRFFLGEKESEDSGIMCMRYRKMNRWLIILKHSSFVCFVKELMREE